ncbi:acyl-CoA dehydrogenase [Streptomyces sp. NPDC054796]
MTTEQHTLPAKPGPRTADGTVPGSEAEPEPGERGPSPHGHRKAVAAHFTHLVDEGALDLPLPGSGDGGTRRRWAALADLAERDLALARLAEGHTDALAILAELRHLGRTGLPEPQPGERWAVWAAEPPGPGLHAERSPGGTWLLSGLKPYCSGARVCTHALVTARDGEESRLFALRVDGTCSAPVPDSWPAPGMAASDTLDMRFESAPAVPVGPPGAYVERPGFHHGGIGVAACWYGGARAVAATLLDAARERGPEPHALAHLGAVDSGLEAADALLERAAAETDADPEDRAHTAARRALRVRAFVEATASDVLRHVGRALGAGPLGHDAAHARDVADLTVYLRQHHAERDLARLGAALAEGGSGAAAGHSRGAHEEAR